MASRTPAALATVMLRAAWLLAAVAAVGCGTRGDASVLPDKWPRAGLSGYTLYDADSPFLLSRPGFELDEPAALPDPESGGLTVFGRMVRNQMAQPTQLFRAPVPALDSGGEPELALEATLPWEGAGLRGPSFADAAQPLLFYQGQDGSVGLARLEGDAVVKLTTAAPLATAAQLGAGRQVGRVGAALDEGPGSGMLRLYYTVDDAEIFVAEAAAASVLQTAPDRPGSIPNWPDWQVRPLRLGAADFQVPPGDSMAVTAEHISSLSVHRTVTPAGRVRWELFLTASAGKTSSIVAAAAYAEPGGQERFTPVATAVLKTSEGTLLSPMVTTFHGRPLLLAGLHTVQQGIAAAVQPYPAQ
jgi:hypothetical protein